MIFNTLVKENEKRFALEVSNIMLKNKNKPVFVCVGTDKIVGDCLSPIVATKIKEKGLDYVMYGDLDNPITYTNLQDSLRKIKHLHPNQPIVVIDSVLGKADEVGSVKLEKHGVLIGGEFHEGVYAGDYHILGVVNIRGIKSLTFLKSVRLKNIIEMADFIVNGLVLARKYCLVG